MSRLSALDGQGSSPVFPSNIRNKQEVFCLFLGLLLIIDGKCRRLMALLKSRPAQRWIESAVRRDLFVDLGQ
jgi:hypothetical protein